MLVLTMRSMPQAASVTSTPSGPATSRSMAARAASTSRAMRPPANPVVGQVAEDGVGVGHRRLVAAAAVAGRARRRARALRPDQEGALADPGDRAAAGSDALHVDHRQADVVAVAPVPVGLDLGVAVPHEADVEAGAAHVDGDEVGLAAPLGGHRRAHDPTRGTGAEQAHGLASDVFGGHDPAGGLHDQQRSPVAGLPQRGRQVVDVVGDAGGHVGVDQRGRDPLELGAPGHHFVGQRDVTDVGELLADDLAPPAVRCPGSRS